MSRANRAALRGRIVRELINRDSNDAGLLADAVLDVLAVEAQEEVCAALEAIVDFHLDRWLMDAGGGGAEGWQSDELKAVLARGRAALKGLPPGA